MRRVAVFWYRGNQKIRIGELAEKERSPIMFEWDRDFLSNPIELSPLNFQKQNSLVECGREPFGGLPGLFADHVPDGWGRTLLRYRLQSEGLRVEDVSPLDLLGAVGENAMGALAFAPALRNGEVWAEGTVTLDELESGVQPIIEGTPSAVLDEFLEAGSAPNGMRPKIILKEKDGLFYVGRNELDAPEWLIKFRAAGDPKDIGKLEYIYSVLAKDAGLQVPETKLFKTKKGYFFGARRFDRVGQERIHMHTLSGLLNVSPGNFSVGYEHLAKVSSFLTKNQAQVAEVFKLATFNALAANQDDHSKNVAFLMDSKGIWSLAPAYDLTFHRTRYEEHKMSLFGKGKIGVKDLQKFALEFGIAKSKSKELLSAVKESLAKFKTLARDYELAKPLTKEVAITLDAKLGSRDART